MKTYRLAALAATLLLCTLPAIAQTIRSPVGLPPAPTVVVRAGHVIDVENGRAIPDQSILIEDGKITAVGDRVVVPDGTPVIDLSDSYVMPGLMDAHVHLAMTTMPGASINDHGSYYYTGLIETTAFRAIQGVAHAQSMLDAGFVWLKDIGNNALYADVELRRAIEGGWIPGPNIIATGRIIAPFGGQFQMQPEKPGLGNPEYYYADSPGEIRKAVRENIHYGAGAIKLVTDNQPYFYSVEEIRAAVEEAGDVGFTVAAHAYADEAIRRAVEAGVASVEHGNRPSDETLQLMAEKGTFLVGTDFPASASSQAAWERIVARNRRALAAGVKMAFGSDVVYSRPGWTRGELTLEFLDSFTAAGFPNGLILQMLTMNNGELLRVNSGQIAEGFNADLVAMDANPLDDVHVLNDIHFVMKDGRVYKQDDVFRWEMPRDPNNPRRKPVRAGR